MIQRSGRSVRRAGGCPRVIHDVVPYTSACTLSDDVLDTATHMTHLDDLFEDLPKQLSVNQVADVLGIRPPTVYKWLRENRIPGYKVESVWVIIRDELKAHVAARANLIANRPPDTPQDPP